MSAIKHNSRFVAEAPTGIGKTFAYLVPALLAGKKTIVSTGTKNLQDQLFFRDLPFLLKATHQPIKVALLKGRQNYVCHHRLEYNQANGLFPSRHVQNEFFLIKSNLQKFTSGDRAEFSKVDENAAAWSYATSTADNCIGKDCQFLKDCFIAKARKKAQQADLVVINHHLFFADCLLKDEGFTELLPEFEVVIFDEAHQLPSVASQFFGERLTTRQLDLLMTSLTSELEKSQNDDKTLLDTIKQLQLEVLEVRDSFKEDNGRYAWAQFKSRPDINKALTKVLTTITELVSHLQDIKQRSPDYLLLLERALKHQSFLQQLLANDKTSDLIYWLELFKKSVLFNATPVSIAKAFHQILNPKTSYIFTSATLSTSGHFDYFQQVMGIEAFDTKQFDSSFDYSLQSLLYLPRNLPDPNATHYTSALIEAVIPVIKALSGRTFLLFTSFKALHQAEALLSKQTEFNLFVQGNGSKTELVEQFRQTKNAVLLGTNSFWEGVDVRGDDLSCVMIDKLPFESPYDPVIQAKIKNYKKQGIEPFDAFQLPLAIIALKQGLGRLIRDEADKGVMIIGDPRLSGRAYGEAFLKSLPEIPLTRDRALVLEFVQNLELHT